MILKNYFFRESENVHIVDFGHGTVHMGNSKNNENTVGYVELSTGVKKEIGEKFKPEDDADENIGVVLSFSKVESIDALIDQLQELKEFLKEPIEEKND